MERSSAAAPAIPPTVLDGLDEAEVRRERLPDGSLKATRTIWYFDSRGERDCIIQEWTEAP